MSSAAFIAQLQAAEVAKPTERSLHNLAGLSQATPVRLALSQRFQERANAQCLHQRGQCRAAVGGVALQNLGFNARSSSSSCNGRHGDDQVERHPAIVQIGRRRFHDQRQAFGVGQHMAFAAGFRPIRRIGAGVRPPKTARTLALSMTARSRLTAPAFPRVVSKSAWSLDQTDKRVHSLKRRQQVLPLPQFSSAGKACQGIPVRSTKIIPAKAWRCGTGACLVHSWPVSWRFRS